MKSASSFCVVPPGSPVGFPSPALVHPPPWALPLPAFAGFAGPTACEVPMPDDLMILAARGDCMAPGKGCETLLIPVWSSCNETSGVGEWRPLMPGSLEEFHFDLSNCNAKVGKKMDAKNVRLEDVYPEDGLSAEWRQSQKGEFQKFLQFSQANHKKASSSVESCRGETVRSVEVFQ